MAQEEMRMVIMYAQLRIDGQLANFYTQKGSTNKGQAIQ